MQRILTILRNVTGNNSYMPIRSFLPTSINMFGKINLLEPSTPMVNSVCGFKVKGRVTRRCKSCFFVVRDGRMHVICKEKPRHKQMAMRPKPHNTWILTHASQSRIRPW